MNLTLDIISLLGATINFDLLISMFAFHENSPLVVLPDSAVNEVASHLIKSETISLVSPKLSVIEDAEANLELLNSLRLHRFQ